MTTSTINIKLILDSCSVKEKVELFKQLYEDIASCGIRGDTELAHINPFEANILKLLGGVGTVNEITGLVQYFGGGSPPPPPPSTQSITQQTEFPSELKPYITDVLSKAQAIQEKRESEGYIPYEGPQVAAFTPEQEQAFTGISGLVGQGEQYFDPATRLAASSAIAPRAGEVQQYMSPFMQNVVEIQQREAQRQADVAAQQLGAQAVGAGAYGGSRQAILEAEQKRNLNEQLADIQARGLAAAYEDAQRRIAEQRGRELSASGQFMQLGQVAPAQQQRELTALEAVGAQRQAQSQRGLDIARSEFEREQLFPEQTLQQYQSVIRGFPLAPTTYETKQTTTPAPSYLQQAAGLGTTAIGLAGAFGGFGRKAGGLVSRMQGGQVDQNNGLGSVVVKKQEGGSFVPPTRSRYTDPNYQNPIDKSIEELVDALGRGLIDPPTFEYRIEQLRKGYNKAGMPLEQEPIPKELGRSPLSVSPIKARIEAQERKAGLSMADLPVTPSLETEEIARQQARARQTQSIFDVLAAREGAEEMVGPSVLRSKAVSPAIREAARESDELAELRRQIQSGIGGADQPIIPPRENLPSSVTLDLKPPPSTTPEAVDKMPSNAEMAGYRAGLAEFTPLTSEPETAKDVDKLETDTAQKASSTFTQNIADNPLLTTANKEVAAIKKQLDTLATSRKARLDARKKGLDSDRWLAVANLGASILAQPGGQTFLQAIGKGAKESGILASLSKLNREEADIADKLETIDIDTLMKKYQLSKDEAAAFARERDYGFKVKQAEDKLKIAREEIAVARSEAERKVAEAKATAAREQLKFLAPEKPLNDKQQDVWDDQFKGLVSKENLKTVLQEKSVEKFNDALRERKDLQEALRERMTKLRKLNPNSTQQQILRDAIPFVYGPYLR